MEEIFEIRSCIEILANDIKVNTADEYMLYSEDRIARSREQTVQDKYIFEFLPARRYASAGNSDRNVSVRLSVTRQYCVKTKKASGMISPPSGSPKTLVF